MHLKGLLLRWHLTQVALLPVVEELLGVGILRPGAGSVVLLESAAVPMVEDIELAGAELEPELVGPERQVEL